MNLSAFMLTCFALKVATSRRASGDTRFASAEAAGRALGLEAAMLELGRWLERRETTA